MAKITQKERDEYQQKVEAYKTKIDEISKQNQANSLDMII